MIGIVKQVAIMSVCFVAGALLTCFAIGAPNDLTVRILTTGLPITIVSTGITLLLIKYFNPTT